MSIDDLFSRRVNDSDWLKNAASCILKVLGPAKADWWAVDWQGGGGALAITALAANSDTGALMASEFPATTHADLAARMARTGGITTVTSAGLWTEHARDFFADMRRRDAVAINVSQPGSGLVVGRLLGKRAPTPPGDRRQLAPVVRAVNLAWRARKYLALGHRDELAEAILHPSGAVLEAPGAAARRSSLQALRAAVAARENARRSAGKTVAGSTLWSQLVEGRWSLVDDYEQGGHRYILAIRNNAFANAVALTAREARAVELAVLGRSAKQCVDDLGASLSAVYALRTRAVKKLSLCSLADVVSLGRQLPGIQLSLTAVGDEALKTLGMPAAVRRLSSLTDAEREVGADLLQGLPQREIARRRGRSVRTIANQVASIYKKLGVGGRTEFATYSSGTGGDAKARPAVGARA